MVVPIEWLKAYIQLSESPQEIAQAFTSIGYMLDRPIEGEGDNALLDLEVRQNRSDCLSLVGLARELGALLEKPIIFPKMVADLGVNTGKTTITIPDPERCPRFFAVTLENIEIKDSPDWLKKRLEAYGIRSINNMVDITNYVSIELGMPMHVYDADKVKDRTIIIRNAHVGEKLILFGGKEVTLTSDDIVHADPEGLIGFGALMGGEEKSVSNATTSIILEAAVYDQASVRRSSRRHAIRTEASSRLEKFLHPELVEIAIRRALQLIQEVGAGEITGITDEYVKKYDTKHVDLTASQLHRLTGIEIPFDEAIDILKRLGFGIEKTSEDSLTASVPYYRTDVDQEEDLIEEVIRIYGYDKIPEHLPAATPPTDIQSPFFTLEEKARDIMAALGYDEVITEPLVPRSHDENAITLENSLSSEKTELRTTMQGSLEQALDNRKKYRVGFYSDNNIKLFEIGKIYFKDGDSYVEKRVLAGIITGKLDDKDVLGDVEILFERLGYVYDGRFISLSKLDKNTIYISADLEDVYASAEAFKPQLLSSPPQVILHDISEKIPDKTNMVKLTQNIIDLDSRIYSVDYRSGPISDSMKEIVLSVAYHDSENPLSEQDVKPIREKIISHLKSL